MGFKVHLKLKIVVIPKDTDAFEFISTTTITAVFEGRELQPCLCRVINISELQTKVHWIMSTFIRRIFLLKEIFVEFFY